MLPNNANIPFFSIRPDVVRFFFSCIDMVETLLSLPLLYKQTAAENCQQNNLAKNDFSFRICWWNDMTLVQLPPERRSLFLQRIEFRRMASSVTFCMKFTKKCKQTADIPIYIFVSELLMNLNCFISEEGKFVSTRDWKELPKNSEL